MISITSTYTANLLYELAAHSASAELIAEADRIAQASQFSLFETVLHRP
jgi:hypothetical protein